MNPIKIKDWFIFGEWHGVFWFHSCYFYGMAQTIRKLLGYGLSQVVAEQDQNVLRVYFSRIEWTQIGRRYLQEVIKEPQKLKKLLFNIRRAADQLVIFSDRLNKTNIKNLKKSEQKKLFKDYHKKHHQVWALGQVPNVLELENSFLADYLKSWLSKQTISKAKQIEYFQILITPEELSMAQKQEREILELAAKKNPKQELEKHWQKYKWLQFGWTGPDLKLKYFTAVHQGLYKEGNAKNKLSKILKQDKQLIKDKEIITKSLKMPKEIQVLFRLLEELLFIKAHRMDAIYRSYSAVWPLLKKIASTYNLSLRQVYSMYADWLTEMMEKDLMNENKINNIVKYSIQYFDGNKTYLLTGKKAKKITNEIRKNLPKTKEVAELRGEIAYAGKVKGRVVIINLAAEMHKLSEGDILVSNVTDPSLLPAMKKAAAFVTNMGGLTCHAAIVARELKIPCIIGTKIATKVLKDGDLVEVDANRGVVRKL